MEYGKVCGTVNSLLFYAMDYKLGFSTGSFGDKEIPLTTRIKIIGSFPVNTIELNMGKTVRLKEAIAIPDYPELLQQFKFRSIHAPNRSVRFPDENTPEIFSKLHQLAEKVNADAITFHADNVDDWKLLEKEFGSLAVVENMDVSKKIGKSIDELEEIFAETPLLGFVLDLNHIYSLDRTMKLTEIYYETFKDRLRYYHISGLGNGPHDFLHKTKEQIIVDSIPDLSFPIIDEGGDYASKEILADEYGYITNSLSFHPISLYPSGTTSQL